MDCLAHFGDVWVQVHNKYTDLELAKGLDGMIQREKGKEEDV